MRALALLVAALLAAACTRVAETEPLPWLRVKEIHHGGIGGASGATEYRYYVKRFGFAWLKLDEAATGAAVALDADSAAISTEKGLKILRRGEEHGTLACGNARSTASVVAAAGVIDCIDVVAGPGDTAASKVRWRRISGAGEALVVEDIAVEGAGRVFVRPTVSFYDAGHQPYFVTRRESAGDAHECALLWVAGGEVQVLAAPEGTALPQCSEAEPWSRLARRVLRAA